MTDHTPDQTERRDQYAAAMVRARCDSSTGAVLAMDRMTAAAMAVADAEQAELRRALMQAQAEAYQYRTALEGAARRAVVPVLPPVSRADVLTDVERQFLTFALDQAAEEMSLRDGFTDEDHAALERLRRMADEEQPDTEARCTCADAGDCFAPAGHYRDCPKALWCPECDKDLSSYHTDDLVFRTGDERPYCSGECVIAAHRSSTPPAVVAEQPDDADLTETDIDRMMAAGTPVQIVTEPPATYGVVAEQPAAADTDEEPCATPSPDGQYQCVLPPNHQGMHADKHLADVTPNGTRTIWETPCG